MKKVFSICVSILILVAMLHLSIATHYCGGKETAVKISLTGKLATCGMEGLEKELPLLPGTNLTKHCCNDVVAFCGTDSNYTPSYSFLPESYQYNFQVFAIQVRILFNSCPDLIPLYTNVSPPGTLMSANVDLSDICVYRI